MPKSTKSTGRIQKRKPKKKKQRQVRLAGINKLCSGIFATFQLIFGFGYGFLLRTVPGYGIL